MFGDKRRGRWRFCSDDRPGRNTDVDVFVGTAQGRYARHFVVGSRLHHDRLVPIAFTGERPERCLQGDAYGQAKHCAHADGDVLRRVGCVHADRSCCVGRVCHADGATGKSEHCGCDSHDGGRIHRHPRTRRRVRNGRGYLILWRREREQHRAGSDRLGHDRQHERGATDRRRLLRGLGEPVDNVRDDGCLHVRRIGAFGINWIVQARYNRSTQLILSQIYSDCVRPRRIHNDVVFSGSPSDQRAEPLHGKLDFDVGVRMRRR